MYFSKNSRYVLQKAQVLSPNLFKVTEKNLSVKTPSDDPAKPPLRINIPKDSAQDEGYPKRLQSTEGREGRSRSFTSAPRVTSITPSFDEGLLQKCESEMHFPNFVADNILISSDLNKSSIGNSPSLESPPLSPTNYSLEVGSKEDYTDGLGTILQEESTANALCTNFLDKEPLLKGTTKLSEIEEQSPQSIYIIIDVPEQGEERVLESRSEVLKEVDPLERDDFDTPLADAKKLKKNRPVDALVMRSKSQQKMPLVKEQPGRTKRFEIEEVEDAATYVFHLKLNNKAPKPSRLSCVPEKEVSVRNVNAHAEIPSIKVSQSAFRGTVNPQPREVASLDEFCDFTRHQNSSSKHKSRKTVEAKVIPRLHSNEFKSTRIPPKFVKQLQHLAQENRSPPIFERDDFGTIRSAKTYPFKLPGKASEKGEESRDEQESQMGPPEEQVELSSVAQPRMKVSSGAKPRLERSSDAKPRMERSSDAKPRMESSADAKPRMERSSDVQHRMERSSVVQPQTELPSDAQPRMELSSDAEPRIEHSPVVQPQAELPSVVQPQVELPSAVQPQAEMSPVVQPQAELPSAVQPQTELSPVVQPQAELPSAVQPQAELPAVVQPQAEHSPAVQPQTELSPDAQPQMELSVADTPAEAHEETDPESRAKMKLDDAESRYLNITELEQPAGNETVKKQEVPEPVENPSPYFSIHELKKGKKIDKTKVSDQMTPKKQFSDNSSDFGSVESEAISFQSCVSIESEKIPCKPGRFSAAFPPLLSEALKNRFKFNKPNLFDGKLGISLKDSKRIEDSSKSSKVKELLENSILFPKKEKFDCESLFTTREEVITSLIKNSEEEKKKKEASSGAAKKLVKSSSDCSTEKLYADNLTVMKKVKEIVQFDLDNVVKIFNDGKAKDVASVVLSNGDGWKIDSEELNKQYEKAADRMKEIEKKDEKEGVPGNIIEGQYHPAKYLPTTKVNKNEMKLSDDENSVIRFDPRTNEFFIKKDELAETIARKANEPLSEVSRTLDFLAKMETKSGDSILVFDEETQSWKVDFSILERREEQMKIEEELTKRSEMILETFEQLEKGQIRSVPIPDTREKQTFDYKNEQWNVYNSDKKSKDRSKSPFQESDAEEIRKRNSDLYENLFIANKKNSRKTEKVAPGVNQSKSPKESRAMLLAEKEKSETTSQQGPTPLGPEPPKPGSKAPPEEKKKPPMKDDNFWESFLNMNILPRDIRDIPKLPPVVTPPQGSPASKIEEGSSKKIEEPKFKIRIPFIKDKKNERDEPPVKGDSKPPEEPQIRGDSKAPEEPPVRGDSKAPEEPDKKPPLPPTTASPEKSEKTAQDPPPKSSSVPKEGPPPKKPTPTIGSSETFPDSKSPEIKEPSGTPNTDVQEPKSPGKPDKLAATATDHYVSDKIIEISRNKSVDNQPKVKAHKIETVQLNITSDTRLPSKVTEINLNKKAEEKAKETTAVPAESDPPSNGTVNKTDVEKKTFQKTLEKYQTPYSEPDFEEKSMKIKSDLESNPNLKKLDNWSKTVVLHDIMKPPENIESWLKDETDKMATLLLKVLQEAADGKPKKKQPLNKGKADKQAGKANPYDNIRKKQETTPENFLFRVRTVNVALENDKKKPVETVKMAIKSDQLKETTVQAEKMGKLSKAVDPMRSQREAMEKEAHMPVILEDAKIRVAHTALESAAESGVLSKELSHARLPLEITDDIPGPEILKKISNTWKMFPILGSQMTIFTLLRVFQLVNLGSSILGSTNPDKTRRHAFSKLFLKYGPIVNVQGPLSGNVILIHTPEHLTGVFEQDITTSVRSVFDSLEQCRRESEENGFSVGISTDWTKPEWNDLKRESLDPLLRGGSKYFGLCDAAGESLINNIKKNRNPQNFVSEDFMDDIKRWSLEGLCSVIFEKSFGFLEGRTNSGNWILEPDKLYLAIDEATNCLSKCERGFQMWRLMSTPSATGLSRAYRNISSILSKQLYQTEVNLKSKAELVRSDTSMPVRDLTFVEGMLLNDGMTTDEITCNLVDMLLIGTNTMNSAMGFLLYNLAQNTKVQMKLLKELKEVLAYKDSPVTYNKIASLSYLQACLKETLRLHFPVPVFYRLLQNDILLANYIVPKGTFVVMDYRVSSMKEQFYDEPDKFIPERWLMDEQWLLNNHPFGAFPLCHGPRAELAKKVVELQLLTCAAKLIRNFHIEYQFGEIQGTDAIISVPDKPLKLNFIEREL